MENKKMTKKEMFAEMVAIFSGEASEVAKNELIDFCNHEIEMLGRKRTSKKETELQKSNSALSDRVVDVLTNSGKGLTITEIQNCDAELKKQSNQRISAIARKLIENGKVLKSIDGKTSKFSLI